MIRFITEHRDHQEPGLDGEAGLTCDVESLCAVRSEHAVKISPSTYYEWVAKQPTKREVAGAVLVEVTRDMREDKKTGFEGDVVAERFEAGGDVQPAPAPRPSTAAGPCCGV